MVNLISIYEIQALRWYCLTISCSITLRVKFYLEVLLQSHWSTVLKKNACFRSAFKPTRLSVVLTN